MLLHSNQRNIDAFFNSENVLTHQEMEHIFGRFLESTRHEPTAFNLAVTLKKVNNTIKLLQVLKPTTILPD